MTERIITDHNGRKHITTEPLLHPPQRKPLTVEELKIIWQNLDVREGVIMGLVRAVEAAHGIKENT